MNKIFVKIILLKFILLVNFSLRFHAQETAVFSFEEFRTLVNNNHPVARQADLQLRKGESAVLRAKGNFDPKLSSNFDNKEYYGKDYYMLTQSSLTIPTPFAVEFKGGYEYNSGQFLNAEDQTPSSGLVSLGLALPIIQGLAIDERRTAIRQAKAFNEFSKYERLIIKNDLLLRAYYAYWDWWGAYMKQQIANDILSVASNRFDAVKLRALAGQAPLVDTLEAAIQVLIRQQQLQEAFSEEIKLRYSLSSFLWDSNSDQIEPRVLRNNYAPDQFNAIAMSAFNQSPFLLLIDSVKYNNPYLAQFDTKLENISAEERLKREKLKPKLNVRYNFLAEPVNSNDDANYTINNYKWGAEFSLPLLFRSERGDLALTRIKIEETHFERQLKTQETINKANSVYQNITLLNSQITMGEANVKNYAVLLDGERTKFFNGESSLFLVNQRELQYVDVQSKLIDLKVKLLKAQIELSYLLGVIS
jgi:outer membrane protein TolC